MTEPVSAYRLAIELTSGTIMERARLYRNQVMTLVASALLCAGGALMMRALWPLAALLFLVPVCGLFLWLDARRVGRWRQQMLAFWERREIEMEPLAQALRANPALPATTLEAMLALLGSPRAPTAAPADTTAPTRRALGTLAALADAWASWRLVAKMIAALLIAGSICTAVAMRAWEPLVWASATLSLPLAMLGLRAVLRQRADAAVRAAEQHPDFDRDMLAAMLDRFHVRPA